jgi:hypothetical protein
MKLTYRSADGRITGELESKDQKGLFQELARFQEVFEDSTKCGVCGCGHVKYVVRTVDGNDHFELHCRNPKCRARRSFGVNRVGGSLFPHRKDKEGNYLPNNGWAKWEPPVDAGVIRDENRLPASHIRERVATAVK